MRKFLTWFQTKFYSRVAQISLKKNTPLRANGFTKLTKTTVLGENCHFNGFIVNGKGKVIIGDNFHSGANCRVITDHHNYKGNRLPYDNTYITKDVVIGDNVWLGRDVIILGGVNIGEGAIIQAGSVVAKSIKELSIAGGHPAVCFSTRDKCHYYQLKSDNKFH